MSKPDQLESDFDRDGFVVMRDYLSADESQEMRDRLTKYHETAPLQAIASGAMK